MLDKDLMERALVYGKIENPIIQSSTLRSIHGELDLSNVHMQATLVHDGKRYQISLHAHQMGVLVEKECES